MSRVKVWAPIAERVELETGGGRKMLTRGERGWWSADLALAPGTDYGLALDGGEPLPDPRSPFQPHGVHGLSRTVDHGAFPWRDEGWQATPLGSAVIYELHVGTYTPEGTFDAAIERLDALVDLGVTHVELMPVVEFSGDRGWGYDGVDLYAPHHAYGGPDALKRLVDACHARRLAVLLDVVYNHLGPVGNHLQRFGPYFTGRYRTPWGDAVNLDGDGSEEVRRYFCDNALMWLAEYHFDGLRVDAVHAIMDHYAVHFLEQLALEVEALGARLGRHLVLIAESDLNDPRVVRRREVGGYGFDAQWNEDFHHALHAVLTGERDGYYQDFGSIEDLAKAIEKGFVYDGGRSRYRGRRHGRPIGELSALRFVGCLQNHDQIGNRALGERMSALVDVQHLKIGAALVLLSPFVPMLFQGEEWGASSPFLYFTDHQDAELAEAVRRGRREEFAAFGWDPLEVPDPQAEESFQRSKLDWNERARAPHAALLEWHRSLIRLRRERAALTDPCLGHTRVRFDEDARWIALERGDVLIACNLDQRAQIVTASQRPTAILLDSSAATRLKGRRVEMPGATAAVLEVER